VCPSHLGQSLVDDRPNAPSPWVSLSELSVKNPVLPHGASSKEKAILAIHPLPLGWAPALPSGASWLFHVNRILLALESSYDTNHFKKKS
jgi:hypothetical protein